MRNIGGQKRTVDLREYLTVKEVAERLDLTQERVRELIREKQIMATKVRRWRIKPRSLGKFVRARTNS